MNVDAYPISEAVLENSGKVCRLRTAQVVKLKTALEQIREHASGTGGVSGTFSRPIFDIADAALNELEKPSEKETIA